MNDELSLFKPSDLQSEGDWLELLETYGHVWFTLDGVRWFVFPEGPHKYGLCHWRGRDAPNFPEYEFESEAAFLNAKLFNGQSILERLEDVLCFDP